MKSLIYHPATLPYMSSAVCLLQAPPGSPPDVSARLLRACNMAAGGQQ